MFTRRITVAAARASLTAAALGLVALGLAGTAGASSVDDAFLAQLQTDESSRLPRRAPSPTRTLSARPSTRATHPSRSSARWPRRPA